MNENKCPICGKELEEGVSVCPDCSAQTQTEDAIIKDTADTEIILDMSDDGAQEGEEETKEDAECAKKAKTLKLVIGAMAAVIVLLLAFIGYRSLFGGNINTIGFDAEDVSGRFSDSMYGMYMDFEVKKDSYKIPYVTSDASADSSASSDAVKTEYKDMEFDGTFESGYTDEYIKGAIINAYISDNELGEEYKLYKNEQNIIEDDFIGFAAIKGVTEADLEKIDQKYQLKAQGQSYTTDGYWKYDEDAKQIIVYDKSGAISTTLCVTKSGLVDSRGYMKGKIKGGKKLSANLLMTDEDYGLTEEVYLYKDGNCISKAVYSDQEGEQASAGTYRANKTNVELIFNGQSMVYKRVDDGLGFFVYTK